MNIKKIISFGVFLFGVMAFAQNVILSNVAKTHENTDKFLYKINPEITKGEYLGEILVNGFSNDDVAVFDAIYKKAKQIGANTFSWRKPDGLEDEAFNPNHYMLSLYYVAANDIPKEFNTIYLVASSNKDQKISINKDKLELKERHFIKKSFNVGEEITVSTRQFLGSGIKVTGKEEHPAQYFQISNFKVKENKSIYGGINIKTSDIIGLERSYGDFLTTIYTEQK
ncbi:hypothetical protein SAMN05660477_01423 [Soonwooa buanensis]|uniref:Uncharacterized protein n=1 Tax=Soonwooa buanensis TaxID=619805 RepID=A0A1T5EHB8_9FLAO|nr:hypothetical protein [Soonwooa buanensis]SKB83412.1 hypothetical protein SAMN05660477_01423 [Soonwooa buanensis]